MTRRRGDASPSKTAFKASPKGTLVFGWRPDGSKRHHAGIAPGWGQGPALQSPLPTNERPSGFRPRIGVRGMLLIAGMTNERLLERSIPDRSPGHAFILPQSLIVPAGTQRRAHQVMKSRSCYFWVWYSESARR